MTMYQNKIKHMHNVILSNDNKDMNCKKIVLEIP